MRTNDKYRDQVADLILIDEYGNDLFITSNLERIGTKYSFTVGDHENSIRYKIEISITEL